MTKIVNRYREDSKVSPLSRYRNIYRVRDDKKNSYMETADPVYISEDRTDSLFMVDKGHEHRIDLISFKFYNTPLLWWVIAEVNGISNPMLVYAGTVLRIPSISRLHSIGGILG